MTSLERLVSIADFEAAARRRLPSPVWDVIAGGAGDEVTLRRNRTAFLDFTLRPRTLVDIRTRDLSTTVLGQHVSLPVLLAPTGLNRMAHRDAELAVARAAGRAGTISVLSTLTTHSPEEVARAATGPVWFQLYLQPTPEQTDDLVRRAQGAGFSALVVTVDTALTGLRERDIRSGLTVPLRLSARLVAKMLLRPAWAFDFARGGVGRGAQGYGSIRKTVQSVTDRIKSSNQPVTVADLRRLRALWTGPLLIKGVLRGEDCATLLDLGVDGIIVSNHGGRQLDGVPAAMHALPEVVAAVGGRAEVLVDGGFRRGTDVAKALALGARAVLIGRPYLYGLAVAGERGVDRVLAIFRAELSHTLGLLGCTTPADLDATFVSRERALAPFE